MGSIGVQADVEPGITRPIHGPVHDLFPVVYEQLRALAARQLRAQPPGCSLQPTALVHEVFLKLAEQHRAHWRGPEHFLAVAAVAARRVLVDHVRRRAAAKNGGRRRRVALPELSRPADGADLLGLDEALTRLAQLHPRQARVAELRLFAGMTCEQAAVVLEVSRTTAVQDWSVSRAWLSRELGS